MEIKIALAGNPNCGKTTLFNALTGSNQYVGNWPGVTVEKKEGRLRKKNDVIITDLPGIYSLSPYTLEEVVARDYLINQTPSAIINIIDGTNLERNLYLTTQLLELGIPVVMAINMMDIVKKNGDKIDIDELSRQTGCKVIEISALKKEGLDELTDAAIKAAENLISKSPKNMFSGPVEHVIAHIEEHALAKLPDERQRWYAIKLFERDSKILEKIELSQSTKDDIENHIKQIEKELDDDAESIITNERYIFVSSIIKSCYIKKNKERQSVSDKIDRVVTNRVAALQIFAIIMFLVYFLAMAPSAPGTLLTDFVNDNIFGDEGYIPTLLDKALSAINTASWLKGLILNGIVAGVGAVLGFIPQIIVLFILLAFLEGCGYMARIAFVMDRIFRKFGLSGKSFIPILVATGCGVPGIMATRTIENERDRRMTIMTTTFIPCSAKLPFIALIAGSVFGSSPLIAVSAYFLGLFSITASGIILKKTKMFSGKVAPFVMELPSYHLPTISNIAHSVWDRTKHYVKKAGTIILISTIVVWILSHFGWKEGLLSGKFGLLEDEEIGGSLLAGFGKIFSWIFAPLGWGTWQGTVGTITGLIAKENIVATLELLYNEAQGGIGTAFTPLSGYSFLAFNLLCAPCFAAIGTIKGEMGSRKWFWAAVGYECGFAYLIAFIIYNLGRLFTGSGFASAFSAITSILGVCAFAAFVYMIFRKDKYKSLGAKA